MTRYLSTPSHGYRSQKILLDLKYKKTTLNRQLPLDNIAHLLNQQEKESLKKATFTVPVSFPIVTK
jgi:hypothetical protein